MDDGHTVMVTYPYAYMTYTVTPLAGLGGGYRGGRLPTASLFEVKFYNTQNRIFQANSLFS